MHYNAHVMNLSEIFNRWRDKGIRITPVREVLVNIFMSANKPLSVSDIVLMINKLGLNPNKTTIYREIVFLTEQEVITEVNLSSRKCFYEIKKYHHHHLVCKDCDVVYEVKSDEVESAIRKIQEILKNKNSFNNIEHSLEFYGVCSDCIS